MTLAVQTVRQLWTGNGSTVDFTIPFAFAANDEVDVVLVTTATGVEAAQSYTTHYTIAGSTLTMVTAPASTEQLLIRMDKDLEQQTADFADNTPFLPTTIESSDDYQASLVQQLNERINRCLTFPKSSTHTNIEIPRLLTDQAGYVLSVNDDEDGFEFATTVAEIDAAIAAGVSAADDADTASAAASAASASATAAAGSATAAAASAVTAAAAAASVLGTPVSGETPSGTVNGSNVTFTLAQTPNTSFPFQLFLNGLRETAFTRVGTTITMTTAPETGQALLADYVY